MRFRGAAGLLLLAVSRLTAATFTVMNTDDSGPGSLRQALLDAAATPGFDTIAFAIPGAGVQTITPATPLPLIGEAALIDGCSQPGASENTDPVATNAVLLIELDGSMAAGNGLRITSAASTTIQGLVINRWDTGIRCSSAPMPPLYCPDNSSTRGQMAVFITKTLNLQ